MGAAAWLASRLNDAEFLRWRCLRIGFMSVSSSFVFNNALSGLLSPVYAIICVAYRRKNDTKTRRKRGSGGTSARGVAGQRGMLQGGGELTPAQRRAGRGRTNPGAGMREVFESLVAFSSEIMVDPIRYLRGASLKLVIADRPDQAEIFSGAVYEVRFTAYYG